MTTDTTVRRFRNRVTGVEFSSAEPWASEVARNPDIDELASAPPPAALPEFPPAPAGGSVEDVLAMIDAGALTAAEAVALEQSRKRPRVTLLRALGAGE